MRALRWIAAHGPSAAALAGSEGVQLLAFMQGLPAHQVAADVDRLRWQAAAFDEKVIAAVRSLPSDSSVQQVAKQSGESWMRVRMALDRMAGAGLITIVAEKKRGPKIIVRLTDGGEP